MNILKLKVAGSLPGDLIFELHGPVGSTSSSKNTTKLTGEEIKNDPGQLSQILPDNLGRELRQWVLNDPTPGILAVTSSTHLLDGIPWEFLPQLLQLSKVLVIRCLDQPEPFLAGDLLNAERLLAAGWSGKPAFLLPGIQEELLALNKLGKDSDFQVQVWFEPGLDEFAQAFNTYRPQLLHLIPATIIHDEPVPELILSGAGEILRVKTDEFISKLPQDFRPRLVVLNTCGGGYGANGPSVIRLLTEHLQTVVIGWWGDISDLVAVDFARFIYTRIFDGQTIIESLRSYCSIQPSQRNLEKISRDVKAGPGNPQLVSELAPLVYTPWIELLDKPLRDMTDLTVAEPLKLPPLSREPSLTLLTVEFEPQKWLNPALLKNGRPAINRLVLNPNRPLHNVGIAVSCDTGNGISTVRHILELEKGPQPVPIDTWQFPVLYELIKAAVPRRQINFTVSCSQAGELLAETTTSVLWMGCTEWLDQPDTWCYIPAFVDPYADAVLEVISRADEVLKTIAKPTSSFSGYQTSDPGFVSKQVEAVFNCLRDKPYELKYISPPPIAVFKPGDQFASGQRIRTPNEVIENKRGTCHDLAILFVSCLEHIQIYPLVILITGHTFFGFWKDAGAHATFWQLMRNDKLRRPQDPGRSWTITDIREIRDILDRDLISLVEATKVTDRNVDFLTAVQTGSSKLQSLPNAVQRFDVAVDIQASRYAVQPL